MIYAACHTVTVYEASGPVEKDLHFHVEHVDGDMFALCQQNTFGRMYETFKGGRDEAIKQAKKQIAKIVENGIAWSDSYGYFPK